MSKNGFWKKTGGAIGAVAIAGSTLLMPMSGVAMAEGRAGSDPVNICPAIELIEVNGTGTSSINKDTSALAPGMPGWELKNRNISDQQIHTYSIAYPAQAGTLYNIGTLFGNLPREVETTATYGQSRAYGVRQGVERMEKVAAKCPQTKFGITGYSQGAQVAGDISSFVSAGKVKGVDVDKVVGTVLWGDPNRSGNSEYQGGYNDPHPAKIYAHPPSNTTVQRNLEWLMPGDGNKSVDNRVGWAGPRQNKFVGQQGKVISLCSEGDLACAVPPGSSLRRVADMSDKDLTSAYNNIETMRKAKKFADIIAPRVQEIIDRAKAAGAGNFGEIPIILDILDKAAKEAQFNLEDIPTLIDGIDELSKILQILGEPSANETDGNIQDASIAGIISAFHAFQAAPGFNLVISRLLGGASPQDAINAFGALANIDVDPEKAANSRIGQIIHLINFAKMDTSPHAVYARRNIPWKVDGKSGLDWTADYFIEALHNVNSPFTLPPREGKTLGNLADEKSLEGEVTVGKDGEGNTVIDPTKDTNIDGGSTSPTTTKPSEPNEGGEGSGTSEPTTSTKPTTKPSDKETTTTKATEAPGEGSSNTEGSEDGSTKTTTSKKKDDEGTTPSDGGSSTEPTATNTPKPGNGNEGSNEGSGEQSGSGSESDNSTPGTNEGDDGSSDGTNDSSSEGDNNGGSDGGVVTKPDSNSDQNSAGTTTATNTTTSKAPVDEEKDNNGATTPTSSSVASTGNSNGSVSTASGNSSSNPATNNGVEPNRQTLTRTGFDLGSYVMLFIIFGILVWIVIRDRRK